MKKSYLLILLILAVLITVLVSCQSSDTTDAADSSSAPKASDSVTTSDPTPTSSAATVKNPTALPYSENTVSAQAYISVPSASYISGSVLTVNDDHPYQYNLSTLQPSHKIKDSVLSIKGQNLTILFGNTSQNYLLKSSKLFFKQDAFPYLDSMMAQFASDSGRKSAQIVNAYLYSDPSTLTNEFVLGYSIAVNLYEEGTTHSLRSLEFSFDYDGASITCLEWFIQNCTKFGFIYTGLAGTQQQELATFRFVGRAHAIAMTQYDIIDTAVYLRTLQLSEKLIAVTDIDKKTWYVFYQEAHKTNENTVIALPAGATYTVSGDNVGGFIVAYTLPENQ